MVDKNRIRKALKEVNLFVGEVDRSLDNVENVELTEEGIKSLEDLRRVQGLLEEAQETLENDNFFDK